MEKLRIELIEKCHSMNEISIEVYGYCNGVTIKKINRFIEENKINIIHFDRQFKNRKYEDIDKKCPVCGEKFMTKRGHKKEKTVCSRSCSNIFRGGRTEETKNKISESLTGRKMNKGHEIKKIKCVICDEKFDKWKLDCGVYTRSKTCSDECRFKLKSDNSKEVMKNRIENDKHHGWISRNVRSYPEKFFIRVLKCNNLYEECLEEYRISKRELGIDCYSNYFLDFYFPNKKIDLEIDGKQHEFENRKISDEERDKSLSEKGIKVYRIKWRNINSKNGKEYIKNEIEKFIEFYRNY